MSAPTLDEAYAGALAIYSPAVSFGEWTLFEVPSERGGWLPYWLEGDRLSYTWKEISGARWIYVFRRPQTSSTAPAVLVDELRMDAKGQLFATAMEAMRAGIRENLWPERKERGAQAAIGATASFIRQFQGVDYEHYFFASRSQLPSKAIDELQRKIPDWGTRVTFKPGDHNVVWVTHDDVPRVLVLDPITIATHLHARYVAATNDLVTYLSPADDPDRPRSADDKKRVVDRQKKLVLAHIVTSLLDASKNTLVDKVDYGAVDRFVNDYEAQVEYRRSWQKRWALYLTSWLRSGPIHLLAEANQVDAKNHFPDFFLHMAHCHSRLCESVEGRKLLEDHFEKEPFAWVRKYVLHKGLLPSDETVQAIRKLGSAPLEFVKEHAPAWLAKHGPKTAAEELKEVLKRFDIRVEPQLIKYADTGRTAFVGFKKGSRKLLVKDFDFEGLIAHGPEHELKAMWKGAVRTVLEGVELINLAFAVRGFMEALDGDDSGEKWWKLVDLAGASLDATTATLTLLKKGSKKTLARIAFFSAVIDTVVGAKETLDAAKEGKFGKMLGSGIVTLGSFITVLGVLVEDSFAGPIGMLVVGAGFIIKWVFRDPTEYEQFLLHCAWGMGRSSDAEEKPSWFKTERSFKEWGEDEGLDEQLKAAAFLLCRIKIERAADPNAVIHLIGLGGDDEHRRESEEKLRSAEIEMGWIPGHATLELHYTEQWMDPADSRRGLGASVTFGDGPKPKVTASKLAVEADDNKKVELHPRRADLTSKPLVVADPLLRVNPSLRRIVVTGSLELELGGEKFVVTSDPKEGVLYERPPGP